MLIYGSGFFLVPKTMTLRIALILLHFRQPPHRLTIVAINKTSHLMPLSLTLNGFKGRTVRSYTISEGAYEIPTAGGASLNGKSLTLTAPPLSVTSMEIIR